MRLRAGDRVRHHRSGPAHGRQQRQAAGDRRDGAHRRFLCFCALSGGADAPQPVAATATAVTST